MKKGSKCNHQSSQDWDDPVVAYTSRIEPNQKGNVPGMFYIDSGRSSIDSNSLYTRFYVKIEDLKIQKI